VQDQLRRQIAQVLAQPEGSRRDALRHLLAGSKRWPRATPARSAGGGAADDDNGRYSLRAIFDHVKDAIITVDSGGRVLTCNPAAQRVFQCGPDLLAGRHIGEVIPALDPPGRALEALAQRADDTILDLAPAEIQARRQDDSPFTAEIAVSKMGGADATTFVLCLRDVTDRHEAEQALRDSEARYRALVENAPEAIVVLDVDQNRFVDANENAARLFGLSREALLKAGPQALSPHRQLDGSLSFGTERGYINRALHGGSPVFEWLHRSAAGREVPCEVRLHRLPSAGRRLIRASIIDVAARKEAELMAHGERRVLELIAANAPLGKTLAAVVRVMERIFPETCCVIMLLEEHGERLRMGAKARMPEVAVEALKSLPVGLRAGACGAAASLGRQVIVRDIQRDALWADLREQMGLAGLAACCSTPIITAADRVHGTFGVFYNGVRSPRTPELDVISRLTQLAGIALKRKQDEVALRISEARFRDLFENVVDGVYQATPHGVLLSANPALVRMLGYDSEAALKRAGRTIEHYAVAKDRERLILRRRDGRVIVVLENSRVVYDSTGDLLYHEGTITDITERKAAERALFEEKERAQVTLQSIGDAVITSDAGGRVDYLNPVAEELTGWERRAARGRPIEEIVVLRDDETREPAENPVSRCLREGRVTGLAANSVLISRQGQQVAIQDSAAPILDRNGAVIGAVLVFHDVSKERRLHRKLSYYASHDSLTGLINRREFEDRLSVAVKESAQNPQLSFALLYMDLDQFKVVNDTCGHTAGDQLLRQLSELLQGRVRATDVLARLGGHEFAVLLADCSIDKALQVAEDLREAIAGYRFIWREGAMAVGVSIGLVPIGHHDDSVASLLSAADVACYVAKDLGRNRIHVYHEGDAAERHREMQWVSRITEACEDDRLELYFQPVVPIGNRTERHQRHYELLIRMRDEQGELIGPDQFIPAAERYNLMPTVDRWVIHRALAELAYRPEAPGVGAPYTLAINLSGNSLNDSKFLDFVIGELKAQDLPKGAICFEITETAAISNLANVMGFMAALKDLGCLFSLDDFGSGLSSLTYLKNLPVDYLKIDGHFIKNVTRDRVDESMVEAITKMASAMGIQTIAERVDSREVLEKLADLGVAFAQGHFIAVPRSVAEFSAANGSRPALKRA
jgi:diguanylate cyclase (GGDEF)-like protein/PAS domain S-box-containing protein